MTSTIENAGKGEGGKRDYESKLSEGRQRVLAHTVEHALTTGRRTPEDFMRHFPPASIMQGLRDQPQLRANILVIATGLRGKIALKKSAESCGSDLQLALEEGETDAETVVQLIDPDDRVRYLDQRALWSFVTEGKFWEADRDKDKKRHQAAADHIAYIVDRALKDKLVSHRDVVDGIGIGKLAELLPRSELEKILAAALKSGRDNKPYTDSTLLGATPIATLVNYIPLTHIWDQVIVPRIAEAQGFVSNKAAPSTPAPAPTPAKAQSADDSVILIEGPSGTPASASSSSLDLDVDDVLGGLDSAPSKKKKS
jgi:hypothetical protein